MNKEILKEICNMRGHQEVHSHILCFCKELEDWDFVEEVNELLIRGFLLDEETLKSCFGNRVISDGGNNHDLPLWKFRGRMLIGLDLEISLMYYKEFMGKYE